jgi:hypothetical protein
MATPTCGERRSRSKTLQSWQDLCFNPKEERKIKGYASCLYLTPLVLCDHGAPSPSAKSRPKYWSMCVRSTHISNHLAS